MWRKFNVLFGWKTSYNVADLVPEMSSYWWLIGLKCQQYTGRYYGKGHPRTIILIACRYPEYMGLSHSWFIHRNSNSTLRPFAVVQPLRKLSQHNFVHVTTAVLSWHVQNLWFYVEKKPEQQTNVISIGFAMCVRKSSVKWVSGSLLGRDKLHQISDDKIGNNWSDSRCRVGTLIRNLRDK